MAALKVMKQVGKVADIDFLASDALPILWTFALGPLLDLNQFQAFMSLIKSISAHIEREHSRKLQDLTQGNASASIGAKRTMANRTQALASPSGEDVDFESLVSGRKANGTPDIIDDWGAPARAKPQQIPISMSNNKPLSPLQASSNSGLRAPLSAHRSVTPDQSLSTFTALTPNNAFNQPLQPSRPVAANRSISGASYQTPVQASRPPTLPSSGVIDWSQAIKPSANAALPGRPQIQQQSSSSFSIPPPPTIHSPQIQSNGFSATQSNAQNTKQGLDKYESLI